MNEFKKFLKEIVLKQKIVTHTNDYQNFTQNLLI